jgi:hydroxymethylbilane synthase
VEVLAGNGRVRQFVNVIDDRPTHLCVAAERRLLEGLGGDCRSPVAALATLEGEEILLRAEILTNDGKEVERGEIRFPAGDAEAPLRLARALLERAAPALRALFAGSRSFS